MGVLDAIERVQQKPESTRYKILVVSVVLIMGLIIGTWLTLPDRNKLESVEIGGPFKLLWQNVKTIIPSDFWPTFKNLLKGNVFDL